MACQEGHLDCVEMLLERGAASEPANNGLTPLHLAASEGRTAVIKTLVAHGADVRARSRDGYTPLHAAAHHGHSGAVNELLQANADVNAQANHKFTPLHQAAQQGHTYIIQLLLKHNADPNALSSTGQTACAIADRLGYISAVEALRPVTENTLSQAVGDSACFKPPIHYTHRELSPEPYQCVDKSVITHTLHEPRVAVQSIVNFTTLAQGTFIYNILVLLSWRSRLETASAAPSREPHLPTHLHADLARPLMGAFT
ncbi:unnamed protein product [Plutella xylostella]|uniref:(diamondback moth) hypothetical protein n=1 Tax=Plutella xylostella TaxID=51655 RepID=A0A8S4E3L8_PLUXY|nr:unnamed protein product [Plutella xylostella]